VIGRTLARLGRIPGNAGGNASREQILRCVRESEAPLSVDDLAGSTGLHANTVRTHLDVLRAAGRVDRVRGQARGRGRPRWLYLPSHPDDAHVELADALVSELAQATRPEVAEESARRWRSADRVGVDPAATPDEAVESAAGSLRRLGFDAEVSSPHDALYLRRCPYADLVDKHPVICDIHARALEQVLTDAGQPVELAEMQVFPRPGVCIARLRRPDINPRWVVPGRGPDAPEEPTSPTPPRRPR
jgi:predicted ArsR family transcriptional regulator